ncbi:MAG TPA: DUF1059 domain-containing protein [Vicinamibacterales bacterium]|nr:DUF1059 domain-containing protein [Vicinamibacterales bacterium]
MKELGCRDLGGECDFVASGENNEDVKRRLFEHAAEAHPEKLAGMTPEEQAQMQERMDEVLAAR